MDTSGGAEKGGTGVNSLLKGLSRLNVPLQIGPGGVATDDEGHVIDASVAKLREYVGAAVKQAGPNLMAKLKAIKALNLDNAQLQKVFGRQEGVVAMSNLLANEAEYNRILSGVQQSKGYFHKVLGLPSTDESLRAAKLARIGESKKTASNRVLGTETNVYEAVEAHEYSKKDAFGRRTRTSRRARSNGSPV